MSKRDGVGVRTAKKRARRAVGASANGKAAGARPPAVLPERDREAHKRWLLEITQIPTAAGREQRVAAWIRAWVAARPELVLKEDAAGNLVIEPKKRWGKSGAGAPRPIFITAHLDHPAFVVERIIGPGTVELAFRGGVMDEYFRDARVVVHVGDGGRAERAVSAILSGEGAGVASADGKERLFKTYTAELDEEVEVGVGDVGTWALPPAEVDGHGIVHTHACDDLAALAAALSAYDTLLQGMRVGAAGVGGQDVRLIFTRSEEIGFTGAIAACKLRTMPKNARVIALENSRSFADSPIGGGPIVRVGDRMSVFSPRLTAACAKRAEQIAGHAASPRATERNAVVAEGMKWQRKLMAGGACEATVFCAYGYEATCLCLPLGNYHNMADLADVQAGTYDVAAKGPPRVGREFIALGDYEGLVDLLVAIGMELPEANPVVERIEKLYEKHEFVLREGGAAKGVGGRKGAKREARRG
ncbi:MAG: hypothetical protein IT438_07650 [Phycisphaerales bacterium]|nr:hypothetical protein [Phycisphaerales bacterium]